MSDSSLSSPTESMSKLSSTSIVTVMEKGSKGNFCWMTRTYTSLIGAAIDVTRTFQFTCLLFQHSIRSAPIRMSTKFLRLFNYCRPTVVRRYVSSVYAQPNCSRSLAWSSALVISAGLAFGTPYKVYLDSHSNVVEETIGDYNFSYQ